MINNEIEFGFKVLNFVDNPQDAITLSNETPINKVPLLILDDSKRIFDSRVIINYLIEQHGLKKLTLEEENVVSAIYSCLDVSVVLFLMRINGYDMEANNTYLNRQKERIPRNLEYIKPWVRTLRTKDFVDWNYPAMSLYSFLYWGQKRAGTIQLEDYPEMQKFLDEFSDAPGVRETSF